MKERPILFSAPMVRALLQKRKTQTRRVLKFEYAADVDVWAHSPPCWWDAGVHEAGLTATMARIRCPHGMVGDRLWVRETWGDGSRFYPHERFVYRADRCWDRHGEDLARKEDPDFRWRPSIFMRREACRIVLEITDVRVERLIDISAEDARAEGCDDSADSSVRGNYAKLWTEINGLGSWDLNPWVWAISFRRVGQ